MTIEIGGTYTVSKFTNLAVLQPYIGQSAEVLSRIEKPAYNVLGRRSLGGGAFPAGTYIMYLVRFADGNMEEVFPGDLI